MKKHSSNTSGSKDIEIDIALENDLLPQKN